MPRDTQGNTQPLPGTIVSTGDTILPSQHNPAMVDLYAMMTQSLSRDGQGGMRASLNMNGFSVQNVGPATLAGDAVSLGQFQSGNPVGAVTDFAGSTAPPTWMLCFGQPLSRAAYPELFATIGTTYGAGNGSTTFNLPDCRGRVTAGKDDMGGTAAGRLNGAGTINGNTLGAIGGSQTVALTAAQNGPHLHGVNDPGHGHTYVRPNVIGTNANIGPTTMSANIFSTQTSSATTGITIQSSGEGAAHVNVQPTIIFNKIIKVSY